MQRLFRTLRGQLLIGLFVPLAAVALINVWFSYQNARHTAYVVLDHTLASSANSIAEQIRVRHNHIEVEIPPAALGMFESGFADVVYYRVLDPQGRLIIGYGELPPTPADASSTQPAFYDGTFRGQPLRFVTVSQPLASATATKPAEVTVAVTLNSTNAMIGDLWVSSGFQQAALVAVAFLLAWLSVLRSFKPLLRMGRQVVTRRPNDLKPFEEEAVQRELVPFVRGLNQHMERMSRQLAAQRRFIANAAHQLRTPLALLRTQGQLALREDDPSLKDEAAQGVIQTTKHMTRLTNQLLVLSKMEGEMQSSSVEAFDLVALTRQVLESYADIAVARNVDLSFESSATRIGTVGDPTMLREVVANLADNALRYAQNAAVEVTVSTDGSKAVLRVADTGPGIPSEDRELVFERFYRVKKRSERTTGSGLGLAIVREIVSASGGRVELADNPAGSGLIVTVFLPLSKLAEYGRTPLEQRVL